MKKITNVNELKEGQKYLIELEYRYDKEAYYYHHFFNEREKMVMAIKDIPRNTIYEKTEIEAIDTPCLDEVIGILEDYESDSCMNSSQKKRLTEYKKIKSILQNIPKQVELPVVGEKYEFSDDGEKWVKSKFEGYYDYYFEGCWKFIRPIQQSDEETKAIELLKSKGYKVEK